MKKELLKIIVCPGCKSPFSLKVFEKEGEEEIKEGLLFCEGGHFFPIINGIPRILVGELKRLIYDQFPDYFAKYKEFLPQETFAQDNTPQKPTKTTLRKKKTAESFGYEWTKFSEMLPDWEKNFKWYFEPLSSFDLLKNKKVLELGCGKGRHVYYAAKFAKEIVAADLSSAIDIAFHNNRNSDNIHFIQADVFNLPFRESSFDFIYSLGVLHHLPDPEGGFRKLVKFLREGGGVLLYIYHSFTKHTFHFYALKAVNILRFFTTKIPHSLLYLFCYPIALFSYSLFVLPYKLFKTKKVASLNWPLKIYADYPFRVLLNDTFDRFSAPIENRYSKEEMLAWYQRAGLKDVRILSGWRVFGKKTDQLR